MERSIASSVTVRISMRALAVAAVGASTASCGPGQPPTGAGCSNPAGGPRPRHSGKSSQTVNAVAQPVGLFNRYPTLDTVST